MNKIISIITVLMIVGCSTSPEQKKPLTLETHMDSVSYSVGLDMASRLEAQFTDVNHEIIIQGMNDYYNPDKEPLLSEEEKLAVIQKYTQVTQVEKQKKLSEDNLAAGELFLKENLKKDGVKEGPTGMQYKVIKEGTGIKPHFRDHVKLHYEGRLIDNSIFDSSFERGEPVVLELGNVIPGFAEGVQLMSEGSTYELYIPGKMAYGDRGGPGGPNSLLIFKVELLDVLEMAKSEKPHQ